MVLHGKNERNGLKIIPAPPFSNFEDVPEPLSGTHCIGTVNRGYFERFLHSTLNIFFINCSTDINPTPYLGLNMGPSLSHLRKKLAPLKFLIF